MKFSSRKDILIYSFIPFGVFILYFVSGLILSETLGKRTNSSIISTGVLDILSFVIFGIMYRILYLKREDIRTVKFKGFSGYGWLFLLLLFIPLYVFSQSASRLLASAVPVSGAYLNMSERNMVLYMFLSITFGPLAEEVIFRGFLYMWLRETLSPIVCFVISSLTFSFIHGTLPHAFVTIPLTLFLAFVLEITGKLRYAFFFHILYNIFALSYIFSLPLSPIQIYIIFVIIMCVCAVCLSLASEKGYLLQKGSLPSIESVIDKKRKQDVTNLYPSDNKKDDIK